MHNLNILIIWNLILNLTFYRSLSNYQTKWKKFLKNILNFFLKKYPIPPSEQSIFSAIQVKHPGIRNHVHPTLGMRLHWRKITTTKLKTRVLVFRSSACAQNVAEKKGNRKLFTAERKRKVKQSFHGNFPKRLIESSDFCRAFKSI